MSTRRYEDLEGQLKKLYSQVPAAPSGLATGRQRMLAEAARLGARVVIRPLSTEQAERIERRRKMNLLFAYKILAAVMAVVLAVVGAGGSVVLAADSLPSDFVYPVKLITEDLRLLLTTDPANRAELAMTFATERVQEMVKLANQDQLVPDSVVARMTRQMEETMVQIARSRPEEVPALLQRLVERAQAQQQVLEQAQTTARQESQPALGRASQVMERAHQIASAGLADPERFRREYQHRHGATLAPQSESFLLNEPQRSQKEHQHRHEGTPGPHGEPSPSPMNEPQQSQEQHQHQYEGTPGPHGQPSPSPMNEPQQSQEQHQHQYEGTPGPHGQPSPSPVNEPQQSQEQHQHQYEGTPGPHGEPSPAPTNEPQQSQEQHQYEGTPGPHGGPSTSPEATPSPTDRPNQGGRSGSDH